MVLVAVLLGGVMFVALTLRDNGYRAVIVSGGSMGDSIPSGSLVATRWRDADEIVAGDVILMREDTAARQPKIHRVIDVHLEGGVYVVQTQGDGNQTPDPEPYALPDRVLVSVGHVPYLGALAAGIASPLGWLLLVALPLTVVAALSVRAIWKGDQTAAPA